MINNVSLQYMFLGGDALAFGERTGACCEGMARTQQDFGIPGTHELNVSSNPNWHCDTIPTHTYRYEGYKSTEFVRPEQKQDNFKFKIGQASADLLLIILHFLFLHCF